MTGVYFIDSMATAKVTLPRQIQIAIEHYRNIETTLLSIKEQGARKVLHWICFRRCCLCLPLPYGIGICMLIQLISLTPFIINRRDPHSPILAAVLMALVVAATIAYSWAILNENPRFILVTMYLTSPTVIFHVAMLNFLGDTPSSVKEKTAFRLLLIDGIVAVISYFYLIFMLFNTLFIMRKQ